MKGRKQALWMSACLATLIAALVVLGPLAAPGDSHRAWAGNPAAGKDGPAANDLVLLLDPKTDPGQVGRLIRGTVRRRGRRAGLYRFATDLPPGLAMQILRGKVHARKLRGVSLAEPLLTVRHCEGRQSTVPALGDDELDEKAFQDQPAFHQIRGLASPEGPRGQGIRVAVIDTGSTTGHEVLSGHLSPVGHDFLVGDWFPEEEANGIDDDGDGLVDEARGHGTFVSGLVASLAPEAEILPLRILNDEGLGDSFALADAIWFAVENGADVINLSLGLESESLIVRTAIEDALAAGVVVVVAAGNEGSCEPGFPADVPGVLTVTAVGPDDGPLPWANTGASISVCAPGVDLIGPWVEGGPGSYAHWEGTSFSAPMVSAAAALVLSERPWLPPGEVGFETNSAAFPLDYLWPEYAGLLGAGRLDLRALFSE